LNAYFDAGVLLKAYVPEPDSDLADALILSAELPLPCTHLHELEMRNALRLKRGRGDITEAELRAALRDFHTDIGGGRLERPAYDLVAVFHKAEELSAKYAAATLARSLDILHVATALVIRVSAFVSFDERQRKVARRAGLKVLPPNLPARVITR
jgi:predicted nucleic acid-binding protein